LNPANPGHIFAFAQGGDSSPWRNDLDTGINVASWSGLGGIISTNGGSIDESNPAPLTGLDGIDTELKDMDIEYTALILNIIPRSSLRMG